MPTNKLWIEHTEQAAWESVSALRSELAEAKKRVQRLTPPVEGWEALFEALDVLRKEHALGGRTYADVVRGLVDRLDVVQGRLRAAQEELARARYVAPPSAERAPSDRPSPEEAREFEIIAKRFVRAMQRRYFALFREHAPTTVDELVGVVAAKADELSGMDDFELTDSTVDLAVLALCLHKAARGE
jgi:hypothetical protein